MQVDYSSNPQNTCSDPKPDKLSKRRELTRCEKAIRRYEQSSLEAGAALKQVADEELFKLEGHDSLKAYVEATCTFDWRRAQQLVRGAESLEILQAAGVENLPTNEAQVRPFAGFERAKQVETWEKSLAATEGKKSPSKRDVQEVADVVSGKTARRASDLTKEWSREAVRALARFDLDLRRNVAERVNADVARALAMPESERDDLDTAAASGVTKELVVTHIEAYTAEVAESGLTHAPDLTAEAADAVSRAQVTYLNDADEAVADEALADGDGPEEPGCDDGCATDGGCVTKKGATFLTTREKAPLLVEVPAIAVPASLKRHLAPEAKSLIVEIGELGRSWGSNAGDEKMIEEIRLAARESGLRPEMNVTNELVDWARHTSNPLTGCRHSCADVFCYAYSIANRLFAQRFTPTLYPGRLDHLANTEPPKVEGLDRETALRERSVFMVSMGDLFGNWVPAWYVDLVLEEVEKHPEWFAFFLTKNPGRLSGFTFPANSAVGMTITGEDKYLKCRDGGNTRHQPTETEQRTFYEHSAKALGATKGAAFTWLSLEPMRAKVYTLQPFFDAGVQMVAMGGQSKTAVCPAEQPDYWNVVHVQQEIRKAGVHLFEKDNLRAQAKEIPFPLSFLPGQGPNDDAEQQGDDR